MSEYEKILLPIWKGVNVFYTYDVTLHLGVSLSYRETNLK